MASSRKPPAKNASPARSSSARGSAGARSGAKTAPGATRRPRSQRQPRRLWPWLALAAGLALVVGAWLVWPFWQLAGQFGAVPSKQPSRLYGRSLELVQGEAYTPGRLLEALAERHYRQVDTESQLAPGTFWAADGTVEAFRRRFPTVSGEAGGNRLRVTFKGSRISALSVAGQSVARALLDPPLVASYYGSDLRERRPVSVDEVPEDLILSVLAIEDASFLDHSGVSLGGIARALWVNLRSQEVRQGGSTLTQQLVKNIFLTHDRKFIRKLQEALLAVSLEVRFEKRDILQAYLNEIYWGRSGHVNLMGVGAAAWAYFGKHPVELSLDEAALLAGMIQAPATFHPVHHPEAAKARRDEVLRRLGQLRWVANERLAKAANRPIEVLKAPLATRRAPYFADAMEAEAERRFGVAELRDAGYVLLSTLDLGDQRRAEAAVAWGVKALEEGWEKDAKRGGPLQAALVSLDPSDGAIRAYVGGRSYAGSQFDRVSQARRQAGSAFKPIVYAAAYEARVASPASYLQDAPLTVQLADRSWTPRNSNNEYSGWISTRTALERSLNVPTARLAMDLGLEPIIDLAHGMGIQSRLDPYPALALGAMEVTPLELAQVYATLAAGGLRPALHGLLAVRDRSGEKIAGLELPPPQRVLSPEVTFVLNRVLTGVVDRGTAVGARKQGLEGPLAGKTGTTNDRRDSWFGGYAPERATLVWVGYDDNSKTRLSGARAALPIWARFTQAVKPVGGYSEFAKPPGVIEALIDPSSGGLATELCPEVEREYFLADFSPSTLCPRHSRFRQRGLEQPQGVQVERQHPFKRWLRIVRKKDRGGDSP